MYNNNFENEQAQRERQIKELQIQHERLEREYNNMLAEMKLDMTRVEEFLDNRDNFDDETWKAMQDFQKTLDEKYDAIMSQRTDQVKTKTTWENLRNVQTHWIPVR